MRIVLPESRELDAGALVDAYDWPRPTWLRTCLVMSLDGCIAGPDGLSGSISSATDRAVLGAVRALADAYLVGAGTVRAEGYGAVARRADVQQRRRDRGQRPAPTLAIVSGSCRFDWAAAAFTASDQRPIILTADASDPADRRAASEAGCDVVVAGGQTVEVVAAVAALRARGLTRITAEGGPSLIDQLVRADLVDEVALTISPALVAGARGAATGAGVLTRLQLVQVISDDGFLFTRHTRLAEA